MSLARISLSLGIATLLAGCTATNTFSTAVRSGDTVALAVGWNIPVNMNNLTAQITDSSGMITNYGLGDSRFRTVAQLYPDPVSDVVTGTQTLQNYDGRWDSGIGYFFNQITSNDPDWNQTVVYMDLPQGMATGVATINLAGPSGNLTAKPLKVNVLPGMGVSNPFNTAGYGPASDYLYAAERHNYYTITFTGATIPSAIQVDMTRTAGVGAPWVTQGRGDLKNLSWRDDGSTSLRVMLSTNHGAPMADIKGFKFYVAGRITGLEVTNVSAYYATGAPVSGIVANVSYTP
jgi:hypothetical protein